MVFLKEFSSIILFQIFVFSLQNLNNISYINNNELSIKSAIYTIRNSDGKLNLDYKNSIFFQNEKKSLKKNYQLIKYIDNNEKEEYFYIRNQDDDSYLTADKNKINFISKEKGHSSLWKMIPKIKESNQLIYYIQNKKYNGFWELTKDGNFFLSNKTNISSLNSDNEFIFNELYKEIEKKNSNLLEKEPIDVYIKYIDLSDKNLNRTGINQIKKDEDNQELKYSVRSILKNIPWIRKIFILMPNEKIKFFKPIEEINERIVYIKDKDLLGFDSANNNVFAMNLHKMKKFGMSENFIFMDDDYFIGQPLNKGDFFYEDNGKILPALITSDYYEMDEEYLEERLKTNLEKRRNIDPHSSLGFFIQQTRALLFAYKIFGKDNIRHGKKLIEPAFTHNAIPIKMSDIEEIHDYVIHKYEYGKATLTSLVRSNFDLQMQVLYMAYVKNKYDRKVNRISAGFYDLTHVGKIKNHWNKLFVINNSNKVYTPNIYKFERDILNQIFPEKTKYELEENEIVNQRDIDKINEQKKNLSLINNEKTQNINRTISEKSNNLTIKSQTKPNQSNETDKINEEIKNISLNTKIISENISNNISVKLNNLTTNISIVVNQIDEQNINTTIPKNINITISEKINELKTNLSIIQSNDEINKTFENIQNNNINKEIFIKKDNIIIKLKNNLDLILICIFSFFMIIKLYIYFNIYLKISISIKRREYEELPNN